ncbi:hypothetical protein D3C78_1547320 [compost metagenome]
MIELHFHRIFADAITAILAIPEHSQLDNLVDTRLQRQQVNNLLPDVEKTDL